MGVLLLTGMVFIAHAMTLGELQGKALIGRALDLSVPVQASQGDELSEGCVRADIYYGDAQQKSPASPFKPANCDCNWLSQSMNRS